MQFEIIKYHDKARLGRLTCLHGVIDTPAFIFCATKGTIKCQLSHEIYSQAILTNTYHLMHISDLIEQMGKLHRFMSYDKPMFTDSGGFQIFSLGYGKVSDEIKGRRAMGNYVKLTDEGAIFKSYKSGKKEMLSPERSIYIQNQIGSDFLMTLDICTPYTISEEETRKSMNKSHIWEKRSLNYFIDNKYYDEQSLYGIVQGGIYKHLREESVSFCEENDFFGTAIGGSLGNNRSTMYNTVEYTMSLLTKQRPVHLLGIGGLYDIYHGVINGIDTFDCVHITRMARHGAALVKKGKINILNSKYKNISEPIEQDCKCDICQNYSLSYLHYLFKTKEMSGMIALTRHNMYFMENYMKTIRLGIKNNDLNERIKDWLTDSLEETTIM